MTVAFGDPWTRLAVAAGPLRRAARRCRGARRSPQFTIAFPDERSAFRPGEAIPIVFSYDDLSVSRYSYEHAPNLGLAEAHLDHADGTVYPLADYDRAPIYPSGGILSGVIGGIAGRKSPPIFPATRGCVDSETRQRRRHHLHESVVQRAFRAAVIASGTSKPASCHSRCDTHLPRTVLGAGFDIRTIQELLRQRDVATTMIHTRVLNRGAGGVRSPLDR